MHLNLYREDLPKIKFNCAFMAICVDKIKQFCWYITAVIMFYMQSFWKHQLQMNVFDSLQHSKENINFFTKFS
jgi:hypothetical protein